MFSVKVKVFTAPSVPLVGDSRRRMVLNPLPSTRPFKRARDVTALRCSEPLRSKVGGPKRSSPWFCGLGPPGCCGGRSNAASKPSPCCAGWDRLGIAVYSLQLIVYSLRLISWLFADNLQISC